MTKLLTAKLTIEHNGKLTDAQLEAICEKLDDIGLLDKLYGVTRELIREYFSDHHQIDVTLE